MEIIKHRKNAEKNVSHYSVTDQEFSLSKKKEVVKNTIIMLTKENRKNTCRVH